MTDPHREGPRERRPVLVVGAGPVGLVAATELLAQGVPVRLVDHSAAGPAQHSRASVVWPRSLELLGRIGASEPLIELGNRLDAVRYYSDRRHIGSVEMSRLAGTPYPFGVVIPQDTTEEVIRGRLAAYGGEIEFGSLTGLDISGRRPVADVRGADGTTERIEAEYVIGADGARSAVRRFAGIEFLGSGNDVLFAIGDGPVAGDMDPHALVYGYSRSGALGIAPFGHGQFRLAISVPDWQGEQGPPPELFQRFVDERSPRPGIVGGLEWSTIFRARRRVAETMRAGRVFLAGDAAHVFSAAGAQGMNTGIQDAVNLAWKLAGVANGLFEPGILDTYDSDRHLAAERIVLTTAKQTSWGLFKRRHELALRDAAVRLAHRTGALQRFGAPLMAQHDVSYRPAESLRDTLPGLTRKVSAGDRLPVFAAHGAPQPGADRWPCVDPARPTLLLWAGDRQDADWVAARQAAAAAVPDGVEVRDISAWPGFSPLLGTEPKAVLVRPDGHVVALTAPEPAAVRTALRRAHTTFRRAGVARDAAAGAAGAPLTAVATPAGGAGGAHPAREVEELAS
ncbi:FAD-dependent monooxygenase [Streptomyces sp. NRRL F-5126]|uniref:FAD-dependent monooxygenase n=1 Tax=Streptomyces sp. NRRL F-5126 TaxID=1463857 RepID=UPI0006900C82|nr:FAD-dependent monooxygenase [Streptomyces sp. NRRL F-5126]